MRERILQAGCWVLAAGCGVEAMVLGRGLRAQGRFWPGGLYLCLVVGLGFLCLIGARHFGRELAQRKTGSFGRTADGDGDE